MERWVAELRLKGFDVRQAKPFSCLVCKARFKTEGGAYRHIKNKHRDEATNLMVDDALNDLPYAGHTEEDLESLTEWECQDIHGGRMPFCDSATCKHPQCHPLNDDRIRKKLGIINRR